MVSNKFPWCYIILVLVSAFYLRAMDDFPLEAKSSQEAWRSLLLLLKMSDIARAKLVVYVSARMASLQPWAQRPEALILYRLFSFRVSIPWFVEQLYQQYVGLKQAKIKNVLQLSRVPRACDRICLRNASRDFSRQLITQLADEGINLKQGKFWLFLREAPQDHSLLRVTTYYKLYSKGKFSQAYNFAESLVAEYKIHLMPCDQDMVEVIKLVNGLIDDVQLSKFIPCIKILNETPQKHYVDLVRLNYNPAWHMPARIVMYVNGKQRAQSILARLYEFCKKLPGCGFEPSFNEKVADSLFYAQGNRDDKYIDLQEHQVNPDGVQRYLDPYFEGERRVHYSPTLTGYQRDYHLC